MNKCILVGNVGRDPESRTLESGVTVTTFSLATTKSYKDKDGQKQTRTQWHNIVAWRGLADTIAKYVHKGDKLAVVGEIETRSWDDKDGNKRYTTEVIIAEMDMLTPKAQSEPQAQQNDEPAQPAAESNGDENDDLPF